MQDGHAVAGRLAKRSWPTGRRSGRHVRTANGGCGSCCRCCHATGRYGRLVSHSAIPGIKREAEFTSPPPVFICSRNRSNTVEKRIPISFRLSDDGVGDVDAFVRASHEDDADKSTMMRGVVGDDNNNKKNRKITAKKNKFVEMMMMTTTLRQPTTAGGGNFQMKK